MQGYPYYVLNLSKFNLVNTGDLLHFSAWHLVSALIVNVLLLGIFIYRYTKDTVFFWYVVYCIFLGLYIFTKVPYYLDIVVQYESSRWTPLNWYLQVLFYSCYSMFSAHFINFTKNYPILYKKLKLLLKITLVIFTALFIFSVATSNPRFFAQAFMLGYIPVIMSITVMLFYGALRSDERIKYFFIIGSLLYICMSFTALYYSKKFYALDADSQQQIFFKPIMYFYIGVFIENVAFSIGLALRVKDVYASKVKAQNKVIEKQKEIVSIQQSYHEDLKSELGKAKVDIINMTKRAELDKLNRLKLEFENEISGLRMKSLQSQMNPHFIFNALNSIKLYMMENNSDLSIKYLNKFAKLMRSILNNSNKDYISLKEELDILNLYLSIENLRFDSKIDYRQEVDMDIPLGKIKIPPLLLQPMVENAIWHGLMQKKGDKKLSILVYMSKEDALHISIRDNGIGRTESQRRKQSGDQLKESKGLQMTEERINHFNKIFNCSVFVKYIDIEKQQGGGTAVEVVYPDLLNILKNTTADEHVQKDKKDIH